MKNDKPYFKTKLILSFLFVAFAIFLILVEEEYIQGGLMISFGIVIGYNDWKTLLSKKSKS
tara:strand:+ start:292 stop:474 length:183 start_codon:yes stop_codon:yes gene_type:complete